jgi:YHS domain-containing protein
MNKKALVVFLITLFLTGTVGYFGYGVCLAARDEVITPENAVTPHTITDPEIGTSATCPVCQANITVQATTPALEYEGKVYYFSSADCATAFTADPTSYINPPENP